MAIFNLKRKKRKVDFLENVNLETIYVDGIKYQTVLTEKFKKRKTYTNDNQNVVCSKIPGTILSINVKEGDSVKMGDVLCILDSMKMNNNIISPFNGVVKSVCVNVNDTIVKGAALIEFEGNDNIVNDESADSTQDEIDNSYAEGLEDIDLDDDDDDDEEEENEDIVDDGNTSEDENLDIPIKN